MTSKSSMSHVAAVALVLMPAGGAYAHATLERAIPAVGSTVASPAEIRLQLSEPVDPAGSEIAVSSVAGAPVATGKAFVEGGDKKVLVVRVSRTLAPGAYKVRWRAATTDAHKSQGSFQFEVRP